MATPRQIVQGITARFLPGAVQDTNEAPVRLGRYGEMLALSIGRKQSSLGVEGTYFVTNNAQTAIASPLITSFTAASPMLSISNYDALSNSNWKNIELDYVNLVTGTAGAFVSGGVNAQLMIVLDTIERYSSAGTDLTPNIVNCNTGSAAKSSIAKVRFGQLVASAPTGSARTLVGLRILRPIVSTTVMDVAGEQKQLNFGGVEANINGSITAANANNIPVALPPIVIGPGGCALIYYVMNGTTPSAQTFFPEVAWSER